MSEIEEKPRRHFGEYAEQVYERWLAASKGEGNNPFVAGFAWGMLFACKVNPETGEGLHELIQEMEALYRRAS